MGRYVGIDLHKNMFVACFWEAEDRHSLARYPMEQIGEYPLCDDYQYYGSRIDGAMADLTCAKAANVSQIPDAVHFESAAMTDPAAIALHAVRKTKLQPGQKALVLGLGAIGFLALQLLKLTGAGEVFAADIFEEKLELARTLGADLALNAETQNVAEAVMERTGGLGADAVIELVGSSRTQVLALQEVRKTGTVVFCGISYEDLLITARELSRILRGELVVKGAWNSSIAPLPINEWAVTLQAMADGRLKTAPPYLPPFSARGLSGGVRDDASAKAGIYQGAIPPVSNI